MAQFNMPLHVQTPHHGVGVGVGVGMGGEEDYMLEGPHHPHHPHHHFPHDHPGLGSPPELAPWLDDPGDGGGKFRLKRRRRCGQCGPCQVKENCGKCQYCLRKDILKQACIYRKCVYLRKPVPRFRSETSPSSTGNGGPGSSSSSSAGGSGGSGLMGGGSLVGSGAASAGSSSSSGTGSNKGSSPQKPSSTPSSSSSSSTTSSALASNHHGGSGQPTPSPFHSSSSSASAGAGAASQPQDLSSCQMGGGPWGGLPPLNNGSVDPLRASALEQHRNALFDASCMLDPTRSAYLASGMGVGTPRAAESGRSPVALDSGRNTNTADSGFGTGGSSITTSPASSSSTTKDSSSAIRSAHITPAHSSLPSSTRSSAASDQFRSAVDSWGAVPYAFPRASPWAPHPALQASQAAAAYAGFQSGANPYAAGPFGSSSCRLGMGDSGGGLGTPGAPGFAHAMPFARPSAELTAAHHAVSANFRAASAGSTPSMQSSMTAPPFYPPPPPPHIPSSLPNFPSFSQLPSSAGGALNHHAYPMAHPSMYPANFYSSFRPPTEPQIYHAQISPPSCPFSRPHTCLPPPRDSRSQEPGDGDDRQDSRGSDERGFESQHREPTQEEPGSEEAEDEDHLREKFSIFCIPRSGERRCGGAQKDLNGDKKRGECGEAGKVAPTSKAEDETLGSSLLKTIPFRPPDGLPPIDEDLQRHMKRITGITGTDLLDKGCSDIISIDDFKMHAFIRSDGFNNLEIEIDVPSLEAALGKSHPSPGRELHHHSPQERSPRPGSQESPSEHDSEGSICSPGDMGVDRMIQAMSLVGSLVEKDESADKDSSSLGAGLGDPPSLECGSASSDSSDCFPGSKSCANSLGVPAAPEALRQADSPRADQLLSDAAQTQCQDKGPPGDSAPQTWEAQRQASPAFSLHDRRTMDATCMRHVFGDQSPGSIEDHSGDSPSGGSGFSLRGAPTRERESGFGLREAPPGEREGDLGDCPVREGESDFRGDPMRGEAAEEREDVALSAGDVVHLEQEGGAGGEGRVTHLTVPGPQVRLGELPNDHNIIAGSSDPISLLHFLSQNAPPPVSSSPDLVFEFDPRESCDDLDLDPEDFS